MDLNKLPDDAELEVTAGALRAIKGPSTFFLIASCMVSFFLGMAVDEDDTEDPPKPTRVVQEKD